jgi:hypothetical protein
VNSMRDFSAGSYLADPASSHMPQVDLRRNARRSQFPATFRFSHFSTHERIVVRTVATSVFAAFD